MKKTLSALLVAVLLFAMAIPAFGADADVTKINTYEQKLIDYVKTAYTYSVPAEYVSAAQEFSKKIDITEKQYLDLKYILDNALLYVKENKLSDVERDIYGNQERQDVLLGYAREALDICGLYLIVDRANKQLTIRSQETNEWVFTFVPTLGGIVKQTGVNYTSVAALSFAVVAAVACAGVSVKAFRKEDEE